MTVVNIVNVSAIWLGHSTEDPDGSREGWRERGFARDARTPDAQRKGVDMIWVPEWAPSCSWEDAGQDPIINVGLAHGLADIALRYKSQRSQGGSPGRDQSRIWQVPGIVTHGEEKARLRSILNPGCGAAKCQVTRF